VKIPKRRLLITTNLVEEQEEGIAKEEQRGASMVLKQL
jgi:hypothetical protein